MKKYLLVIKNKHNISFEVFNVDNELTSYEMALIAEHYGDCITYDWYCIDNLDPYCLILILSLLINYLK